MINLLIFLLIGGVAGWLAGVVMKGRGYGVVVNIVIGVIGAFFGGWLLPKFGIRFAGETGLFITAFIGAVILVAVARVLRKA